MKTRIIALLAAFAAFTASHAQSLLTEPALPPAQARAIRAQQNAQGVRDAVVGSLRHSITDLWSSDYQANVETAAALGNKAVELFTLYESFFSSCRALLIAAGDNKAVAELDSLASLVPAHVKNPDGTVTLVEPDPEDPE